MSSEAFDRDYPDAAWQPAEARIAGKLGRGPALKIAALVLFAALLSLSALYVNKAAVDRLLANETDRYQQGQLSNVESFAERLEADVSKLQGSLFNLSQIAAVRGNDGLAMLDAMERAYLINDGQVDGVFRVDRDNVLVQSLPSPGAAPTEQELRPFMEQARATGQPIIAMVRRHRDARDILVLAQPVYAAAGVAAKHPPDSFAGLILFTVTLERLRSQIFRFGSRRDHAIHFAIDGDGLLLSAHFDETIGKTVDELLARSELSETERNSFLDIVANMRAGQRGTGSFAHRHQDAPASSSGEAGPSGEGMHDHHGLIIGPDSARSRVPGDGRAGHEPTAEDLGSDLVAYAPIRLQGAQWSAALINPSEDATRLSTVVLQTQWLAACAFVVVMVVMTVTIVMILRRAHREQMQDVAQGEQTAREAEDKYRMLVENGSDAAIILTPAGVTVYCNPAYVTLLGLTEDAGTKVRFFDTVLPQYRDLVVECFNTQWWSEGAPGNLNIAIGTPDGQERAIELIMRPIRYRGAQASMFVLHDATQRTQIEDALRKAKDEADAANAAKGEFLARMSHEIRTPMNGVIGVADILMRTDLSAKQRMFVDTIRRSGHALLMVVNDILDFSKIEAGKLELETIDFDLRTTVEDVAELLAPRAAAKGLVLACRVSADMPTALRGDPYRLRQALTNLLGNAVKFTAKGEVSLSVSMVSKSDDTILLRFDVRDTGIGIAPRAIERIFEPFLQADGATTRNFGGTGLGLAITKRLVELMGGEVGVECKLGEGALFWFTAEFKTREAGSRNQVVPTTLHGLRILIVESNATNQEILRELIEAWGMAADVAATGAEAIKMLRDGAARGPAHALALMDRDLPDMDGLNLARAIRMAPDLENVRIVVMSASNDDDPRSALNAGVDGWVNKPVRHSALFDNLAQILLKTGTGVPAQPAEIPDTPLSDRVRGARVLVAEDNPVNQVVAKESLELLGCRVDIADDGERAVEAWSAGSYDVVLMDMQMPVMDGRDATAKIREREMSDPAKPRTPIIALTANAMKGDRERCITVGMDDFVAKPFTADDLRAVLQKWVPPRQPPETDAGGFPIAKEGTLARDDRMTPEPADRPILDEASLRMIRSLGQTGAPSPLTKVIDIYLDYSPKLFGEIESAIAERNAERLCRAAHSLKSSSASLGAHGLAARCKELEMIGCSGTTEGAAEIFEAIHGQFDLVRTALEDERDKVAAAT